MVFGHLLTSDNYDDTEAKVKNTLETSGEDVKTTLETSGEDVKTTLQTSGEDVKLHSKRVGKIRLPAGVTATVQS